MIGHAVIQKIIEKTEAEVSVYKRTLRVWRRPPGCHVGPL